MPLSLTTFLIICPLIFLAGFIDSIAGGGGLISLPAYYLVGLAPDVAAGTNKMSAFFGTAVATGKYAANRRIPWREGIAALAGAVPFSFLGAELLKILDERYVKLGVLVALPIVAVFVLLNKDALTPRNLVGEKLRLPACFLIGAVMGVYDGLVGPGTGTFLQLLFVTVLGIEALKGSGAARLVNLGSNVAALVSFIISGHVLYALALPAALFGMAGNYLGSSLAIKKGSKVIRGILILVLGLLMLTLLMDVINKFW
ncbi:MAG: TSUP family transporter [Clostridiales bacterium]|nr:TSUP family transporter [Clostridiales bacterium]